MKTKIQTLKGFRDFLPEEKRKRDYVIGKIKEVFELYGFEPLETPTLEYASLLLGKYGKEADKLVYTFRDRGDREVALKYDQTVPTARVLAQYQNRLPKYFRRYQIQNVFRADKPQQGRFREFTQCDIDIFGSRSPLADAEIIACSYFAFKNVGFNNILLKLNDRQSMSQALQPFAETLSTLSLMQTFDKLDKIPEREVLNELSYKGLAIKEGQEALKAIKSATISDNLKTIIKLAEGLGVPKNTLDPTPTLARGLDYYTGMIFEVSTPEYPGGSLCGGGRYDQLIGQLGGVDIPAVGVAFGFDRMMEAANQLGLIPKDIATTKVLVTVFAEESPEKSLQAAQQLRQAGISTELSPAIDPLPKQLKYADKKGIPWVVIIGEEEEKQEKMTLKNMKTGEQKLLSPQEAIKLIQAS